MPANLAAEVPANLAAEVPANLAVDVPANLAVDVPANIAAELPKSSKFEASEVQGLDSSQSPVKDTWALLDFNVPESEIAGHKFPDWIAKKIESMHKCISKAAIIEMSSFKSPPEAVIKIMEAVIYVLGYKTKKERKDTIKIFTTMKKDILKYLQSIDFLTLSYKD